MSDPPAHIQLVEGSLKDTEFKTAGERDAAEALIRWWPETHNFSEIARRSGWSKSHIRNVFKEYFEAADEPAELEEMDLTTLDTMPQDPLEAYRAGYRDGFKDGQESE